jgi:hypothetical protein
MCPSDTYYVCGEEGDRWPLAGCSWNRECRCNKVRQPQPYPEMVRLRDRGELQWNQNCPIGAKSGAWVLCKVTWLVLALIYAFLAYPHVPDRTVEDRWILTNVFLAASFLGSAMLRHFGDTRPSDQLGWLVIRCHSRPSVVENSSVLEISCGCVRRQLRSDYDGDLSHLWKPNLSRCFNNRECLWLLSDFAVMKCGPKVRSQKVIVVDIVFPRKE